MSTNTISIGRIRPPARVVVVVAAALLAAIALTVVAVDVIRTAVWRDASVPAVDQPTPAWLQRYLDFEAPASAMPQPEWLEGYLAFEAGDQVPTNPLVQPGSGTHVNEGLR